MPLVRSPSSFLPSNVFASSAPPDDAPRTVERRLRSTDAGTVLLARLPATKLDALLRDSADVPCPSPLLDARLKALGVAKLGHRLQIQAALKAARESAASTEATPLASPLSSPVLESNKTPARAAAAPVPRTPVSLQRALNDLTNSQGRTPSSLAAKPAAAAATPVEMEWPAVADKPATPLPLFSGADDAPSPVDVHDDEADDDAFECLLESNELEPAAPSSAPPRRARYASLPLRVLSLWALAWSVAACAVLLAAKGGLKLLGPRTDRIVRRLCTGRAE